MLPSGKRFAVAARRRAPHDPPVPRFPLLACVLLTCGAAHAAAIGSPTGTFTAEYDGFSRGLVALSMTASLNLTQTAYSGRFEFQTAGLIGFMSKVESDSQVLGHFEGARAVPDSFASTGVLHGGKRGTAMHWQAGKLVLDREEPPPATDRTAVDPALTVHAIDVLSAMAAAVRQAAQTGHCDGEALTFDGRRLSHMEAHTVGPETPVASAKSRYDLPALRCDFSGQELAGFLLDEPQDEQRRTRHGSAWLAAVVPGAPPIPERVIFEHKVLGQVTLYLTSASGTPGQK
jgi:hypothetical protein